MKSRTVAIAGLGLMGGSLARDLSASGTRVIGHDANTEAALRARAEGAIATLADDSLAAFAEADLIVIAAPVDIAPVLLECLSKVAAPTAAITDVGSTKATIVARAMELGLGERFVGSHPLVGDHRSGWDAARTGLYRGGRVFLCPTSQTNARVVAGIRSFWEELGASCIQLDASEHDRRMAWLSHMPQVTSSALAAALDSAGYPLRSLGPGGRDMTRLAGSSPELWTAICLANAEHIITAIHGLRDRLDAFESALQAEDIESLRDFFTRGHEWSS